jgi:hypothetical protein
LNFEGNDRNAMWHWEEAAVVESIFRARRVTTGCNVTRVVDCERREGAGVVLVKREQL